jgi:hypothetical protein
MEKCLYWQVWIMFMPLFPYDWHLISKQIISCRQDSAIQLWMPDYSNVIKLQRWSLRV